MVLFTGSRILSLTDIPKNDMYAKKLKGVSIAFNMFRFALEVAIATLAFFCYMATEHWTKPSKSSSNS